MATLLRQYAIAFGFILLLVALYGTSSLMVYTPGSFRDVILANKTLLGLSVTSLFLFAVGIASILLFQCFHAGHAKKWLVLIVGVSCALVFLGFAFFTALNLVNTVSYPRQLLTVLSLTLVLGTYVYANTMVQTVPDGTVLRANLMLFYPGERFYTFFPCLWCEKVYSEEHEWMYNILLPGSGPYSNTKVSVSGTWKLDVSRLLRAHAFGMPSVQKWTMSLEKKVTALVLKIVNKETLQENTPDALHAILAEIARAVAELDSAYCVPVTMHNVQAKSI